MAFLDIQFPPNISFGAHGGPGYRTDVVVVTSGVELRNAVWSQARRRYDVAHAARMQSDADAVKAFFHVVGGKRDAFRFKDWSDYAATASEGKFEQITPTTFQMVKRYTSGSSTHDRVISKPVSGTVTVTGGSGASVNYATGVVTVSSGTPTAWAGQFDVPCRFDTDELLGTIIDRSGSELVIGWDSIPIVEVRV